ncbi:hypothetical protein B5F07_07955 [Lachnoclostridium sp. An169]|nr:hypothetical protein B5F07_07955 [Lachnoclostridium sp. An169]
MRQKQKVTILINYLLVVCLLGFDWFIKTDYDFEAYSLGNTTGVEMVTDFYFIYGILYFVGTLLYIYCIMKNIFVALYIIDIFYIILFSLYPVFKLGLFYLQNLKFEFIQFYGLGYWSAIILYLINLILIRWCTKK